MLVSLPSLSNIAGYNMTRAIRKKSGTGVKTNWHFVWSCSEIDKMITRTDPMIEPAVEHYVIGYMAFWHIAFVDEDCLVPCNDDALRNDARRKIDRYIADHPPVETFPRFYLVLLRQPIAPMESDGMSRVYQM